MNVSVFCSIGCLLLGTTLAGAADFFSLSDTDPGSPAFRARYLGSFGINAAVEPTLSAEDRPLYEKVLPYLENDYDGAIRLLESEIESDGNASFDFLLGNLYFVEDRLDEAERHLTTAITKHPSFRRAHRTLALVYARQNEYAAMVASLLEVIQLGGGDAQAYGLLGYGYLRAEKYRSALGAYQNARMFAPESFDYKRGEAQCLLQTSQFDQAVALYEELIAENPGDAEFWLLQANAYFALDERSLAAANLEMIRSLGGATYASMELLANLYLDDGAVDLGATVAAEALAKATVGDVPSALGQLEYLTDRSFLIAADRLSEAFGEVLSFPLEAADVRRLEAARARIDFGLGRERSGIERLEAILEEDPLDGRCLLLLAKRYAETTAYAEAEFYFERALSLEPYRREALVGLGQLAVAQGDFRQAVRHLRDAQAIQFEANVQSYLEQVEAASRHQL